MGGPGECSWKQLLIEMVLKWVNIPVPCALRLTTPRRPHCLPAELSCSYPLWILKSIHVSPPHSLSWEPWPRGLFPGEPDQHRWSQRVVPWGRHSCPGNHLSLYTFHTSCLREQGSDQATSSPPNVAEFYAKPSEEGFSSFAPAFWWLCLRKDLIAKLFTLSSKADACSEIPTSLSRADIINQSPLNVLFASFLRKLSPQVLSVDSWMCPGIQN